MPELTIDLRPIRDDLKMMIDVVEGLQESVKLLEESAALFDKYAEHHTHKATAESHLKALVNIEISTRIKDRLALIEAALDRYNA